jgi:hypothetical protein
LALLSGVGDEYAISERPTPAPNSRLTGDRRTPSVIPKLALHAFEKRSLKPSRYTVEPSRDTIQC